MKKILLILLVSILSVPAYSDCDFSKVVDNHNGTYTYSKELHICVGEMKRDLGIALEQNQKLTQALTLKDFALTKANERADLWMDTSHKLEARIETLDTIYNRNKWLYFGLGVLATSAAVYAAGQLTHH